MPFINIIDPFPVKKNYSPYLLNDTHRHNRSLLRLKKLPLFIE